MAITSTPRNVNTGVDDQSSQELPNEDVRTPQHCPIFMMYTERAMGLRAFVSPAQARKLFGDATFNVKFDGFSNVGRYAKLAFGNANNSVIQSIVPEGAGDTKANTLVSIDIQPGTTKPYKRNSDGSFATTNTGSYIVDTEADDIDGYISRLVYTTLENEDCGGGCTEVVSSTISWNGEDAQRIPLFVFGARYPGAIYNEYGFTLAKSTTGKTELWTQRGYDFDFGLVRKVKGNPVKQTTNLATKTFRTSLVKTSRDEMTGKSYFIGDRMKEMYGETYSGTPVLEYDIIHTFHDNINALLLELSTKEKLAIDPEYKLFADGVNGYETDWYDYDLEKSYLENTTIMDFLFLTSSKKIVYKAHFKPISEELKNVDLNGASLFITGGNSPVFISGGTNGYISAPANVMTMTPTEKNHRLGNEIVPYIMEYADRNSRVQNTALNPETNWYDPGYEMDIKLSLIDYITLRKDTLINFTTEVEGEGEISDALRLARLVTIDNAMKLAPESEHYGTAVFRYSISFGKGEKVKEVRTVELGQNFEHLDKLSKYMGAANGLWKPGKAYDTWPASRVNTLVNLSPKELPTDIRDKVWASNGIFTDPKNMEEHFITAMQTGYDDELSVLNGTLISQACLTLEKLNDDAWREVSGAERLSKPRLKARVEEFINRKIKDAFDSSFPIIYPEVYFTQDDMARNYAWHLNIIVGVNAMHTRQVATITTYRIEDLEGGN